MFIPDEYRLDDAAAAFALIEEIRTGSLVTAGSGLPEVSHLPFMVDRPGSDPAHRRRWPADRARGPPQRAVAGPAGTPRVPGHLSRPAGACVAELVRHPGHVPRPGCTSRCMCGGRASLVTDHGALRDMVERLSEELEPEGSGWDPGQIVPYTERLMQYIVGFSIEIERIDTQVRLGQANTPEDRRRVLAALSNGSSSAQQVAALIRRLG